MTYDHNVPKLKNIMSNKNASNIASTCILTSGNWPRILFALSTMVTMVRDKMSDKIADITIFIINRILANLRILEPLGVKRSANISSFLHQDICHVNSHDRCHHKTSSPTRRISKAIEIFNIGFKIPIHANSI